MLRPIQRDTPSSNAASAPEIEEMTTFGHPTAETEFAHDGIPFPTDSLAKGGVVEFEILGCLPVISGSGIRIEESFAEPAEFINL